MNIIESIKPYIEEIHATYLKISSLMERTFQVGDKVRINDPGLIMLQRFAPPGTPPNNEGVVNEILEDGDIMVEFPIGNDDPKEHSQVAPYPADICVKIK